MELTHAQRNVIADRYRIRHILGQGGVGITYAAEDLQKGQQVAIKALSLHRLSDWKALELFEREARTLAQLKHPSIPRYLEYFNVDAPNDRSFYIVQELAEGQSLAKLVENGWHANEQEVKRIGIELLKILSYLHSLEPPVIHRDIKPQNIIRKGDGQVFLVDFGAVQNTYHNTLMRGSTVVGTFGYMAPEQFRAQAFPATDLYGLGATLLFLLTHRSPAELPTDRLKINFRSRVQISEDFADWLEKMLEPDVEDRFSSAKEALAALQGKKKISEETGYFKFIWPAIVGAGVTAVAAIFLNSYKWGILNYFGFLPRGVCEDLEIVKNYLQQGGNPNAWTIDSDAYLLQCASREGNKQVVEFLIAKGADVNIEGRYNETPLHRVTSPEIAELLIAKGADVNARNYYGKTPLHTAASKYKNTKIVKLLIAKGADVNVRSYYGKTPLHYATRNGRKRTTKLLIAKGADVNATDVYGKTPLHYAASYAYLDDKYIEMLITKGANVNATDNYGKTPLHYAVSNSSEKAVDVLIAKGANIYIRDRGGKTPLEITQE